MKMIWSVADIIAERVSDHIKGSKILNLNRERFDDFASIRINRSDRLVNLHLEKIDSITFRLSFHINKGMNAPEGSIITFFEIGHGEVIYDQELSIDNPDFDERLKVTLALIASCFLVEKQRIRKAYRDNTIITVPHRTVKWALRSLDIPKFSLRDDT